jgi:eukaryotic-like serine/threonine-protein kinase
MTRDDLSLDTIFTGAIEIASREERAAFIARACGTDEELRRRVGRLVDAHFQAGSFLESPPASITSPMAPASSTESIGTVIGPYRLLQVIGEGGMGTVYMAEQTVPVRRVVALKLIKTGMDNRQVLARFGAERQALALMDHPNIAKVFDAGTTDNGRPYFVMELVKGVPITKFCDERRLTLRERLELAIPVCQAVQHAHQKGIIHRDLKPSNVLIALYDDKPVPKVIDFGVAKATGPRLTDQTLYTEFGAVVGTLEYMSPEQAQLNQLDIDTRSDIYSLGVLIYELLTGSTPLQHKRLKSVLFLEVLRLIREEESPRPSLRLSTTEELPSIAACRHVEPRKLSGLVRGELDWIVMKALEKDRSRRYETANGLAADLRRYLDDEPVQACPPSRRYRFGKFARRHKLVLTLAGMFAAALLIGVAGLSVSIVLISRSYTAERRAHRKAEANFERARWAVDEFFTTVSQSKLLDVPGLQPLRKELLEAAVRYYRALAEEKSDDSTVRAGLAVAHFRLAEVNFEADRTNDSIRELDAGLDLVEHLLQQNPSNSELFRRVSGFWKGTRGITVSPRGPWDVSAADRSLKKFLQIWERLSSQYPALSALQSDLAIMYDRHCRLLVYIGRPDDAVAACQKAVALWEGLVVAYPNAPEYQAALGEEYDQLGGLVGGGGNREAQVKLANMAFAISEKLTASYPDVAQYQEDLAKSIIAKASFLFQEGKTTEAEASYRLALESWQKLAAKYPSAHLYRVESATTLERLGALADRAGRHQDAEQAIRQALELETRVLADDPGNSRCVEQLLAGVVVLAKVLEDAGRPVEAENTYRMGLQTAQMFLLQFPADRWCRSEMGRVHNHLGLFLTRANRLQDAEQAHRRALDIYEKLPSVILGPSDRWRRRQLMWTHENLGLLLNNSGRPQEAEKVFRQAIAVGEAFEHDFPNQGNMNWLTKAFFSLASSLTAQGKPEEAEKAFRKLLERAPQSALIHNNFAWLLATCADPKFRNGKRAVELAKKAVELEPKQGMWWNTLGAAHLRASNWKDATAALDKSMELRNGGDANDWFFLAMACWQSGDKPRARSWYVKAAQWMEKNQPKNEELIRFRAEAADLLGVDPKRD